jgi:hypothetical protein
MSFKLIDYSEHYFLKLAGEPIPESREGKFVQIRHGDKEYLVLSPSKLSKYHANIVERFCESNGIDGYWNSGKTSYQIVDDSWSVVGGGRWVMNSNKKTLDLGSSSQAYGRFDSASLKTKILSLKAMKGYIVKIGD